jgi:hypothetical protein
MSDGAERARPSNEPEPVSGGFVWPRRLGEPGVLQRIVAASFAWLVTVMPAAFSRVGSGALRVVALAALAAAIAGPLLVHSRPRLGRHVGISAFLLAAGIVWTAASASLEPARLDSLRGGIGAVAWGVYAFSWGEPWRFGAPSAEPGGAILRARAALPPLAVPIAGIGIFTGLLLLTGAWWLRDPTRALVGHAAAIGMATALVTVAASVAIDRGKRGTARSEVGPRAARALMLLALVAVLGVVAIVMRR